MHTPLCEKKNCKQLATVWVTLDAADGSDSWWACTEHAQQFKQWVVNETDRHDENWASVSIEPIDF